MAIPPASTTPLDGKRLLITGAASGIGRATSELAHRSGAQIALFDRDPEQLENLTASLSTDAERARSWTVDLADFEATERAVNDARQWLNEIDVLIHVAGIMRSQGALITDVAVDAWDEVIHVNLSASFNVTRHVVRGMLEAGHGVVILTGSGAGVIGPSGSIPYGASKGGLHGLALTLADQLSPHGIRVNDVLPGLVDTPLVRRSIAEGVDAGVAKDRYENAMLKACEPEDVAKVMTFLASDQASHVRGTIVTR
jgi:NAD(P)-dependent dehydrogenase (short-subunit alcohol dehydrogenase family)